MQVYTLNAFSKAHQGGNPAGVVLVADNLTDHDMQRIAAEVGVSETAFVSKSKVANFRVRFFTTEQEVNLCGHATIATFYLMQYLNIIKKGIYTQETNAGILRVEVGNHSIFMEQAAPAFLQTIERAAIAQSLNIPESAISEDLPVQLVSTGLKDIFVPIKSMKTLNAIKPSYDKVAEVSKMHGAIGYHIFTLDTDNGATARCRNFAPSCGIKEDIATGSASGALGCYLCEHKVVSAPQKMVFEQGFKIGMPSEIQVEVSQKPSNELQVMVGGRANNIEMLTLKHG